MTDPVDLCRIDTTRNMRRFYHMSVQPGLFGDVAFIRQWGRIGTRGQRMEEWFEDEAAADDLHGRRALAAGSHNKGRD